MKSHIVNADEALKRLTEGNKSPIGNGHLLDLRAHDFKDTGLQNHLRICQEGCVH